MFVLKEGLERTILGRVWEGMGGGGGGEFDLNINASFEGGLKLIFPS